MDNTLTKNVTLKDIICSRMNFIDNNNIFDKNEYMHINMGENEAYREILKDIELLTIDDFKNKYKCILKKVSENFEEDNYISIDERERMSGYNNAVVFVLSLINPEYEYELD